jgi:hypothetical protein
VAHEFSVALRARRALLLPHGVLPPIENPLPALRTREVFFRSHARRVPAYAAWDRSRA